MRTGRDGAGTFPDGGAHFTDRHGQVSGAWHLSAAMNWQHGAVARPTPTQDAGKPER